MTLILSSIYSMTKCSTISLYLTKLYVTQSFTIASAVTYSEFLPKLAFPTVHNGLPLGEEPGCRWSRWRIAGYPRGGQSYPTLPQTSAISAWKPAEFFYHVKKNIFIFIHVMFRTYYYGAYFKWLKQKDNNS